MQSETEEKPAPRIMRLELHEIDRRPAELIRKPQAETVEAYAESIKNGDELPPVTVLYDGRNYWLADGAHRMEAAGLAGKKSILATVERGSEQEAQLRAAGANGRHGRGLTNEEKRAAIRLTLLIRPDWTDSRIASHVVVSPHTVKSVRGEVCNLQTSPSGGSGPSLAEHVEKRVGQDGKSYPATRPAPGAAQQAAAALDAEADEDDDEPLIQHLAEPYKRWETQLTNLIVDLRRHGEDPEVHIRLGQRMARFSHDLQGVKNQLRQIEPVAFCDRCDRQGCRLCLNTGFVVRGEQQSRTSPAEAYGR